MDDFRNLLYVYPLNTDPSSEPCRPASTEYYPLNCQYHYPLSDSENAVTVPSFQPQEIKRPDLKPLIPECDFFPMTIADSGDGCNMPSPGGKMMTRALARQANHSTNQPKTKPATQSTNQVRPGASKSSPALAPAVVKSSISRPKRANSIPPLPVLVDARDEDLGFSDGDEGDDMEEPQKMSTRGAGGKAQKGRRANHLSSHAIYARMNRERKKTYLSELEQYKTVMTSKSVERRQELRDIRRETETLTQEIASLRGQLFGNHTLMSLLHMDRH